MNKAIRVTIGAVMFAVSISIVHGAAPQQGAPAPASRAPRATAPLDLTGQWVSVVTEDWRWRMLTAPRGDATGIPLNPEGMKVAESWDLAKDNARGDQCKAFGAGGIMRIPSRLRITWQDDSTLRIETDAGRQTRLVRFNEQQAVRGAPTLQGNSVGSWQLRDDGAPVLRGPGSPGVGKKGSMKVVTTNLRAGYLRKNGIPYSENALVTEYFNRHDDFGSAWFTVTTVVDDPKYLLSPSVTTTHFKRETDQSKWNPQPCETVPPTLDRAPKIPFPG